MVGRHADVTRSRVKRETLEEMDMRGLLDRCPADPNAGV